MQTKFTLTMDRCIVDGKEIDQIVLDWIMEVGYDEMLSLSHNWITSQDFLTKRMTGLTRVGESSLTIEPLDDM